MLTTVVDTCIYSSMKNNQRYIHAQQLLELNIPAKRSVRDDLMTMDQLLLRGQIPS